MLISRRVMRLLDETIQVAKTHRVMRKTVTLAAIDGIGFESRNISPHSVHVRDRDGKKVDQTTTYTRHPTANILCDNRVFGVVTGRSPGPYDPYF